MFRSAYIEKKDFSDFAHGFTIRFGSRFVHVFIWRSVEGLRKNTDFRAKDHYGAYVAYPFRRARGFFGEIHLVLEEIGAGYVAHEIQHFLYDWLMTQSQASGTNEKLATLAGNITKDFWNEYYKLEPIIQKEIGA